MTKAWYEIENAEMVDSPALLVYPDRIKKNIERAIQLTGDATRLRPHIKTHKSPEVSQYCIDAGITKFKCATLAEAEMLGMVRAPDVLISYQLTGPKLDRYAKLIKTYPDTSFSSLVDNESSVDELLSLGHRYSIRPKLFIDLDVGMHRTGIEPGPEATKLVKKIKLSGLELAGFQMYDGHIRDADLELRKTKSDECFNTVLKWLETSGNDNFELICGGSPTFVIHAKRNKVTCSPGTFVYWDQGYNSIPDTGDFLIAAVLISRIISMPAHLICIDLGHKSVAAENSIDKRVQFLNNMKLIPISQSEEHLVLQTDPNHQYKIGDLIYAIPYHICPTVALHDLVYRVENNKMVGTWKNLARTRKLNI